MTLVFVALLLYFLRTLASAELRLVSIPPGGLMVLPFLAFEAMRIPFSAVPHESAIDWLEITSLASAYWAWTHLASHQKRWKILLGLLIFTGTLMSWYAIIQHAHGTNMVLNLERPAQYGMRASGTYMCPNHFAHLLEMLICMSVALACMPSAGVSLRLLAGYAVLLFLPTLFLTESRSGWLAAACGLGVTCWLVAWHRSRRLFYVALVAVPLILAVAAGSLWALSPMVKERLAGASVANPDLAVQTRFLMWRDTLQIFLAEPLTGFGGGTYPWIYARFQTHDLQLWVNYAHNEYLHLLAERGVIGASLLAAFFVTMVARFMWLFLRMNRSRESCLAAGFMGALAASCVHAVFDFNFHIFANAHVLVMLGGVTAAVLHARNDLREIPLSKPASYVFAGVGSALALLLALLSFKAFAADGFYRLGEARRVSIDPDAALRYYRWAMRADAFDWRPYLGSAHVHKTRAFWIRDPAARQEHALLALKLYEEASARNRCDMEAVYGQAKVRALMGEEEAAVGLLRSAIDFAPRDVFYRVQLGLLLRQFGRYREALDVFDAAAGIAPAHSVILANRDILAAELAKEAGAGP